MFFRKAGFQKGRAWIEISRENLRYNVAQLRALLPKGCELMPVLKANAYGHGAVMIAKELQKLGVQAFLRGNRAGGRRTAGKAAPRGVLVSATPIRSSFPCCAVTG